MSKEQLTYSKSIICEVDGDKTYVMFKELFSNVHKNRLFFVCEPRNFLGLNGLEVKPLMLQKAGLSYLRRVVWIFIGESLLCAPQLYKFGGVVSSFFYSIMRGKAETIEGSDNLYCVFEHLVTYKAIRNSFLKNSRNTTMFVSLNSYVTPQFFHSEIFLNYDVFCSGGPHIESTYQVKRPYTKYFLPTGSYESHSLGFNSEGREERRKILQRKLNFVTTILIVSPGICDPTYKHELQLMDLARKLSKLPNVNVVVRLKPVDPITKYESFYEEQFANFPEIVVTAGEFELFDFIGIVDLAITTVSNGAYDLAQAGVDVMFIDFLGEKLLSAPWVMVPEVLVNPHECWDLLQSWVNDDSQMRFKWHCISSRLTSVVAYQKAGFEEYKQEFIEEIRPWLPVTISKKL
jgi:hypothetical protein